jgi:uncharacterized Ntn-hydrolase superfamily protein
VTYSIVARDPVTGELGIAVQSHWFSVGSLVPWARPGVGAVATQSVPAPDHGPRLLNRLADGAAPDEALDRVLDGDEGARYRQTAVVDAAGRVAVHTGQGCIADAGHHVGDGWSCQANMMSSAEVWPAMAEAFVGAEGPLPERLLAALDAAQAAGGDVRGQQSAAMLVVAADRRPLELRVDDHREPLGELRRLLVLHRAYELADEGDALLGEGRFAEAGERYARASELAPDKDELLFWAGMTAAEAGDEALALERVQRAIELNPRLSDLLGRLSADLVPAAPAVRAALGRA